MLPIKLVLKVLVLARKKSKKYEKNNS